jgi:hypothetical protein
MQGPRSVQAGRLVRCGARADISAAISPRQAAPRTSACRICRRVSENVTTPENSARACSTTQRVHGGRQVNLGSPSPQQAVVQICPLGQSPCFLQPPTPAQMPPLCTQILPPPGFFPQKQPLPHPSPVSPKLQVNGIPSTHFAEQVLWTHFCPEGQLRLRRQDSALASRPPSPSRVLSTPVVRPPSSRRRGMLDQATVKVSKCDACMTGLLMNDVNGCQLGFARC